MNFYLVDRTRNRFALWTLYKHKKSSH